MSSFWVRNVDFTMYNISKEHAFSHEIPRSLLSTDIIIHSWYILVYLLDSFQNWVDLVVRPGNHKPEHHFFLLIKHNLLSAFLMFWFILEKSKPCQDMYRYFLSEVFLKDFNCFKSKKIGSENFSKYERYRMRLLASIV